MADGLASDPLVIASNGVLHCRGRCVQTKTIFYLFDL
jgi:hypothetical protein